MSPKKSLFAVIRKGLVAGLAAGLAATGWQSASAHPFAFDTSRMVGFKVVTEEDGAMDDRSMVVIEYDGPIAYPMADNLRTIWDAIRTDDRFERVVLRLDSPGGSDVQGEEVIGILAEMRGRVSLATLVGEGDLCASMCIPIFLQGDDRHASPVSAWMFHGASRRTSNVPSLAATLRYFGLFRERGVSPQFIRYLFENNYVTTPGAYWLSGAELAQKSNIITHLLPNWRPKEAEPSPVHLLLGGI